MSALITRQQDKLRNLFFIWVEAKNKEFLKLEEEVKQKIQEKDESAIRIDNLQKEIKLLQNTSVNYAGKIMKFKE